MNIKQISKSKEKSKDEEIIKEKYKEKIETSNERNLKVNKVSASGFRFTNISTLFSQDDKESKENKEYKEISIG